MVIELSSSLHLKRRVDRWGMMSVHVITWNSAFILQLTAQINEFSQGCAPQKVQSWQGMCVSILYFIMRVCVHADACMQKCLFSDGMRTCTCVLCNICIILIKVSASHTAELGTWTGAAKCVKAAASKESLASPVCRLPVFPRDCTSYQAVHY